MARWTFCWRNSGHPASLRGIFGPKNWILNLSGFGFKKSRLMPNLSMSDAWGSAYLA
jgi:hypothetical protein